MVSSNLCLYCLYYLDVMVSRLCLFSSRKMFYMGRGKWGLGLWASHRFVVSVAAMVDNDGQLMIRMFKFRSHVGKGPPPRLPQIIQ